MDQQAQTIIVDGISCEACIKLISRRFSKIAGVLQVASVEKSGMVIVHVERKLPKNVFSEALDQTAYAVIEVR